MAEGFEEIENNVSMENSLRNFEDVWWGFYNQPGEGSLDLSYLNFDGVTLHHNFEMLKNPEDSPHKKKVISLYLNHNRLDFIPENIFKFKHIVQIDLSNNFLMEINEAIYELKHLHTLIARNNRLGDFSLPKKIGSLLQNLEVLNLSGNLFKTLPPEVIDLQNLKSLSMGSNLLEELSRDIWKLEKLEVLYLGGNMLKDIPAEMGRLHNLRSLALCENQLQSLPSTISCLKRLRSLSLHRNQLTTLPQQIVTLKGLVELSLRDNPLVVRFVQDMTYDPPSLQELAARSIKSFKIPYGPRDLPPHLVAYLGSACRCINPRCRGVYFDNRIEHIKFVDFCGKYRLPLLQYLCSPRCSTHSSSFSDYSDSEDSDVPESRLKRVLLG